MHVAERNRELERQRNSARYAPNLERDRNQLIVVTLHAPDAPAEPFCRHARELCYSVTMPTIGPRLRFIWRVAKNQHCFDTVLLQSARRYLPGNSEHIKQPLHRP